MAHHKRRRPKHQRAGCILCKPYKDERGKGKPDRQKPADRRRLQEPTSVASKTGRLRPDPTWAQKAVAKMSDEQVKEALRRLRGW